MGGDEEKLSWKSVRFDMPTFDVTMCGVLEDDCQDNKKLSGGETHRITALDNPFMAGKHLWLELEGQGMVAIVKEGLAAITWLALVLLQVIVSGIT